MYLRAHFACLAAGLFLLSSCGESGNAGVSNPALTATGTVENSPSADPWTSELSDRIRDAAHAFAAEGEAFTAESAEHGITGRFDAGGAVLTGGGEGFAVRATGWGRAGSMEATSTVLPELGACVAGRADPVGDCVRRLEFADAGLTEWWAAGAEGFEQGWTVEAPPDGAGVLAIDVGIDGAAVTVADGEVWLQDADGEQWIVSGLAAWDASGTPLEARFEPAGGGLRVTVDDTNARYPIEIDPVYTTASTALTGEATNTYFGRSVSDAGDVNGDGYDDVIVGAYYYSSTTGRAYVYLGSATGVSTTATTTLTGAAAYNYFGYSVSGAGDVNGDGYDDVIVGAYGNSSFTGSAYLYAGSATGISTTVSATLTTGTTTSFGYSVSGAGDVNGDGYDDVIVGAYNYGTGTGRAYVYAGSATGLSTTASTTLTGAATYSYFGASVSGAGDVNGDGYDDVIVGAYYYSAYTGRAYVYSGSSSGVSTTASTTLTGETADTYFGYSVSGAGDVNGDGYDDVIVGAYVYNVYAGRVYVYSGSSSGVGATASTTLSGGGGSGGEYFGYSVSGLGDVDADGYDDVIVGAYGYCAAPCTSTSDLRTGRADVFLGSASGVSTTVGTRLTGTASYNYLGISVSGAGDVNGDGYDDVVVGAHGYSTSTGRAYVHLGYSDVDADGDGYTVGDDCNDAVAAINPGATEICDSANTDEDCDGLADDNDSSATGTSAFYVDSDSDGYGSTTSAASCDLPSGYATTSTDCNDAVAAINPAATETCDSANTDEDCDGLADNNDSSATGTSAFYADSDSDGYGSDTTGLYCDLPGGYVADSTDCDDTDAAISPAGSEIAGDEVDQDCDGEELCYVDGDGDGYTADGGATEVSDDTLCDGVGEALADAPTGDYDDTNAGYHPDAVEDDCTDPADYNCDGSSGYTDADSDGFAACEECDDAVGTINPDADEVCNGLDDDCDGTIDVDAIDAGTWYADADGDGYTDPGNAIVACQPSEGYATATQDDCDDADATSHPAGDDIPDDGIDQDCDGTDAAGDTSDSGDPADNGDGKDPTACGCTSTSGGAPWSLALGVLALTRRRRAAQRGSVPPPLPLLRARGGRGGAR